jgi:peptidyl-prolyl cis-trans isomerase SurA
MKAMRFLCILAAGALLAATRLATASTYDGIAVVVNGKVITYLQVWEPIRSELERFSQRYGSDTPEYIAKVNELQTNALEALIQRQLILDDFDKAGYATNVLESLVDDQIKKDIKDNFGGERSTLIKTLSAEGLTYEDYRKNQREQFIIQYMQYNNTDIRKVLISPLKIQTYYNEHRDEFKVEDQVKLRMIVIHQPPNSPPGSAKPIATEILQKIDSGTPFAEMASVYSADAASDGGDQGWVDRKERIPALSDVAFSLKPGQHSGVIELTDERTGDTTCYLLMVDDKRAAHVRPLSEVAPGIEQTLKDQESKRLVNQWIKRLEAKSHIETF